MPATSGVTAPPPASSRPPWWMFVLAGAFAGYFALLLHSDVTRPESAGVILDFVDNAIVVRTVGPDSPASRAGVQPGDRIAAVNGRLVATRIDWLAVEINTRVHDTLAVDVIRGGVRQSLQVSLGRASWSFWTTMAGATVVVARIVQAITLALAVLVAFRRPRDRAAQIGAWVLATLAIYSLVLPYQIAATWRALPVPIGYAMWLPFTSSLAVAAVVLTFFLIFPKPIVQRPAAFVAIWIPMAAALIPQLQFMARAVYDPEASSGFADWTRLETAVTAAYTAAAIAVPALGYRRLTDITDRRRIRVLVMGSIVGLVSALMAATMYWTRPDQSLSDSAFASPVVALGVLIGLALPASFAYGILRHRLFDVGFLIRLGLQYALARRVLLSIVPLSAALFVGDLWLNRHMTFADVLAVRGWSYLALAALAILAHFRRDRWLDILDRTFFRERYNADGVVRRVNAAAQAAVTLDDVAAAALVEVASALHPRLVALLVRGAADPSFVAAAAVPAVTNLPPLAASSKLLRLLDVLDRPLTITTRDQVAFLRQLPPADLEWIAQSGVELIVPLQSGSKAVKALLALGPKRSEEPYSAADEDLLMAIGASLGDVIRRAPASSASRAAFEDCPSCGRCFESGTHHCPADGSPLTATPLPQLLAGRYRLDRRIGRGGMGTVYAAFDTALQRGVAVKLLREDLIGGQLAEERFQSEARLAAGLSHPNVVTVHDFGVTATGRAFLVMELIDGPTLRQELQANGPMAAARLMPLLKAIAAAVDAAHARQLVHRDLKPENIVVCTGDSGEVPKILDFGLARTIAPRAKQRLTEAGLVAGTPSYMAPERWRGGEASPDWDLWALAVIACELMTGRHPFEPNASNIVPTAIALPDGTPALNLFFARALAADPLDRPTSARELVDELDRALLCDAPR